MKRTSLITYVADKYFVIRVRGCPLHHVLYPGLRLANKNLFIGEVMRGEGSGGQQQKVCSVCAKEKNIFEISGEENRFKNLRYKKDITLNRNRTGGGGGWGIGRKG